MRSDLSQIADGFNMRAASYAKNDWHRRCAERLAALCQLQPGERVLDAGTGTGFAAMAAARAVGPSGHVLGIDVSPGMLREARAAVDAAGLKNVELREGDATRVPDRTTASLDRVRRRCCSSIATRNSDGIAAGQAASISGRRGLTALECLVPRHPRH
jgi:ubiquinone/menaquinone biosynthesis C-methylase UbiE